MSTATTIAVYASSIVFFMVACWHAIDARHSARIARIEREAAERMYKLVNESVDAWIMARDKAFADRQDLDRRLLLEIDQRFGSDMAKKLAPQEPS